MYELFISKMESLYKSELKFRQKQKKKAQLQKNAAVYALHPLKQTLMHYNEMTYRGFNSEMVVETLNNLDANMRARGYRPRAMGDYTHYEMEQSWRMQKLVDDITFGLRQDQFFSPAHIAQTSKLLGQIGYKNTDLIPHFFRKLESLINERFSGKKEYQGLDFGTAVYGGPKNFLPRHYIFQGFQDSNEFNDYLKILLDWEGQKPTLNVKSQKQQDEDTQELLNTMKELVDAAMLVKEAQQDFQATIENVRTQYFKMLEVADKHSFIRENEYIKYDLLELQERLVKGGYLNPEEANAHLAQEPFEQKMERAAQVFYDYVLNFAPELISPQYNTFYEAAMQAINNNRDKKEIPRGFLEESHNQLNLSTFSQTLVGLYHQVTSYRRDVTKNDFLNPFYEKYLLQFEQDQFKPRELQKIESEYIVMERSYLKAWKIFKEESDNMFFHLKDFVRADKNHIQGQLHALHALAAIRQDHPELRKEIIENCLNLIHDKLIVGDEAARGGLMGLALSATIDEKGMELAKRLTKSLDVNNQKFAQQLESLWALCALQQYDAPALSKIVNFLNKLKFERLDHDLTYQDFTRVIDIINALKIEGLPRNAPQITNETLLAAWVGKKNYLQRFPESEEVLDPFKSRVIQAIGKGLSQASIDHENIIQNELVNTFKMDAEVLNSQKYPYKPDIVMGYQNQKLGIFVLPEVDIMRDTHQADGIKRFRMRLLEAASGQKIKSVVISVSKVVNYDIQNFKVALNTAFNFKQELEDQIKLNNTRNGPNFEFLAEFGSKLANQMIDYLQTLNSESDVKKINAFVKKLFQIFQIRQQASLRFEIEQQKNDYDELRFQLMQLDILHDTLPKQSKNFVDQFVQQQFGSFNELLLATSKSIQVNDTQSQEFINNAIDQNWLGTRLEVELPQAKDQKALKKSIVPEFINQRFMWVNDYFHYKDWQTKQQQVFDNFNLLFIPPNKDDYHLFFDQDNYCRRIPQGIIPLPNLKRQVLKPHGQSFALELSRFDGNDDFVLFEKEPFKMMVLNEFKKSETLSPIDSDVSMITNLQNIKQSLKANYNDREILDILLLKLNFTDLLIQDHLKLNAHEDNAKPVYLERDPTIYRKFVESTYYSKDKEDPYSHFYLKEAAKREALKAEFEKENAITKEELTFNPTNVEVLERGNKRKEILQEKLDKFLLENELKNEDLIGLSSSLKQRVVVNYDLKTLVKSEFIYDIDPELVDNNITDSDYLQISRRRAESKLIKSKIIYKVNQGKELSPLEKEYLQKWVSDIRTNNNRNLLNLRDSMLPEKPSELTFNHVEAKDYYTLNSLSKVEFDRDSHGKYSVNDLVLELSHFLDEEVVNKIETEILSDRMKEQWNLSKDFKAVETRNKEISLVLNELEEVAFRAAGMIDEKDMGYLKRMLSIKRNKDIIDQSYYQQDMQSLDEYVKAINTYDDRIKKLEKWIIRKEDEIDVRATIAPEALKKSDQQLHAQYDKSLRRARESIVAKLLTTDEHGNDINKQYKDLTSRELNIIAENLCVRLYLFNYEYPSFLPQMVKGIMEHPNLLKTDKDLIDTYCKLFELDWKMDKTIENRQNLMFQNPIYIDGPSIKSYGEITNEKVQEKLRRACAPYLEETATKLLNLASKH